MDGCDTSGRGGAGIAAGAADGAEEEEEDDDDEDDEEEDEEEEGEEEGADGASPPLATGDDEEQPIVEIDGNERADSPPELDSVCPSNAPPDSSRLGELLSLRVSSRTRGGPRGEIRLRE